MSEALKKLEGIIIKAISGFCYVKVNDKLYECKPRGAFRKSNITPVVGDRVEITVVGDKGTVEAIKPRKNYLLRPPISNLDKLFIVSSCSIPAVNTLLIDRMTVIAENFNIKPVIVFNKCDVGDFGELPKIYNTIGYKTYIVSAETNEGIDLLKSELKASQSAFCGNSGVGKSSILNRLIPNLKLSTGDVSQKLGRGRHTTRYVELYDCEDGFVADTPGFSSLSLADFNINDKDKLQYCFKEFSDYLGSCKFTSCSHTTELGCAVLNAVKNGYISRSRHDSFLSMYNDLKDIKPWDINK